MSTDDEIAELEQLLFGDGAARGRDGRLSELGTGSKYQALPVELRAYLDALWSLRATEEAMAASLDRLRVANDDVAAAQRAIAAARSTADRAKAASKAVRD